jgi:hypothetical protein
VEYRAARAAGLSGSRLARLNIQQDSTLRNLGRLDEAVAMLQTTEPDPVIGDARAVFLALALRDAGRHDEALRVCIEALIPAPSAVPAFRGGVRARAHRGRRSTGGTAI